MDTTGAERGAGWPGQAPQPGTDLARRARRGLRMAAQGLREVLVGSDPQPSWLAARSRRVRQLVVVALTVLTAGLYLLASNLAIRAHPSVGAWAPLLGVAQLVPLALLVRRPLLAWRLGYLAAALTPLVPERPWGSWVWDPVQIPVLGLALCAAGLRYGRPVRWTMWALMVALLWGWEPDPTNSAGGTVALTVLVVLLDNLAGRLGAQRALRVQTDRTRREAGRRAALEERARIARELHDVVAHHMSLIAVQAETAPYRHPGVPEPVRAEFSAISGAAREALTDMRRLLGVLRSEESPVPRAPQPELAGISELVDGARRAGVQVELSVLGTASRIPATVGVCGYRIVQESLSNAGRHAAGAPVRVTVHYGPDAVSLSVVNDAVRTGPARTGTPQPGTPQPGPAQPETSGRRPGAGRGAARDGADHEPGHGLTGMRERVSLLGGELFAGPVGEGGFSVRAVLPLAVAVPTVEERAST